MNLELLHLSDEKDAKIYKDALKTLRNNHPYYKIEFLDIFYEGLENAKAFLYLDDTGKFLIVLPFYLRDIQHNLNQKPYYDAVSTWGYSGPLYKKRLSKLYLKKFWQAVDLWYSKNNVVTEFIRFNTEDNTSNYSGNIVPIMRIIKGNLTDPAVIWDNYNRKVRKNISKAQREGLTTKIFHKNITPEIIDEFYDIFVHTLDRNNAKSQYYICKDKLSEFILTHQKNSAIALTDRDGTVIASEIILLSTDSMFSFIGGTLSNYFHLRPNEILKHEVNLWGIKNGFKYFVLGGGLGKEDGIFEYKKSFFPNDLYMFTSGQKIINHSIYNELISELDQKHLNDDFFPLYRRQTSV